jgi:hypothetical protein
MAMMAITTNNSISVNPRRGRGAMTTSGDTGAAVLRDN